VVVTNTRARMYAEGMWFLQLHKDVRKSLVELDSIRSEIQQVCLSFDVHV
jgi:hypothetical protein